MMINLKTKHMNKLLVMMAFVFTACTGTIQQDTDSKEAAKTENEKENVTALQLNNGAKWKLDDATKKNVASLKQIVNDTIRTADLASALQSGLHTLVSQCTMKGPDHDALHQWLEPFMHAVKELKDDDEDDRQEALAAIRKDLENFDMYFE